jgi:aryl-alcohol dehydrogenase-like predicted oxidoreductase
MEFRRMGHTGTAVSHLCLGTMTFGDESDEAASFAMMDAYAAAGGTFLDTADVYTQGASEEIVGRWLKARPTRARRMVVTTKGRFPMGDGPNDLGLSRRHLTEALDASLRRLGIERLDLYQTHAWDALTPVEETLRFLDDAITDGKILHYGFSNYLGWQITKAVHLADSHHWTPPVTLQPQYNLLARDIEHEIVPACLDAGLGLLPWSPLGGGWLTGKYKRDQAPTGATRLGEDPTAASRPTAPAPDDERTWRILDAVQAVAEGHWPLHGRGRPRLARPEARRHLRHPRRPHPRAARREPQGRHLRLSDEEMARLDAASAPLTGDYPYGQKGVAQRHRRIEGGR